MTPEEKDIMGDIFFFLRDHNDPPAVGTDDCTVFWQKTAKDMNDLVGKKWRNHPLAMALGTALYGYIEKKCKEKGGVQT